MRQSALKCGAAMLLASYSAFAMPIVAQPELKPPPNTIVGHVADARTDGPAEGAAVSVYWRNAEVGHTVTDAKGFFAIGNLPPQQPRAGSFVVVARVRGTIAFGPPLAAPAIALVAPDATKPLMLTLTAPVSMRVKVTTTAGQPLTGAMITVAKLWQPRGRGWSGEQLSWSDSIPATTTANGIATITGLPAAPPAPLPANAGTPHLMDAQLVVSKAGFADNVVIVNSFQNTALTIPLPRETIVTGTLMLGNERPLGVPQWRMKLQGWGFPWSMEELWRTSSFDRQGHYEIDNVTSLEILKEPTYSMNLDLDGTEHPTPDISAAYVPPQRGWDVMVTLQRNGKTERWIAYVEAMQSGIKYKEGEHVHHDLHLQPMALLKGNSPFPVSYHNAKSIYGDWVVTPAADGSFELPVPSGDVVLHIGAHTMTVTDLKPQEVRAIRVPLGAP